MKLIAPYSPGRRSRGRRRLDPKLEPWLEMMEPHLKAGKSMRKAAEVVALRYFHEIPQGSAHQRSLDSTITLLRKKYPLWKQEQDRRAKIREQIKNGGLEDVWIELPPEWTALAPHPSVLERLEQMSKDFVSRFDTPEIKSLAKQQAELAATVRSAMQGIDVNAFARAMQYMRDAVNAAKK